MIHSASEYVWIWWNIGIKAFNVGNVLDQTETIRGCWQPRQMRPMTKAVAVWRGNTNFVHAYRFRAAQPTSITKAWVAKRISVGLASNNKVRRNTCARRRHDCWRYKVWPICPGNYAVRSKVKAVWKSIGALGQKRRIGRVNNAAQLIALGLRFTSCNSCFGGRLHAVAN